MTCTAVSLTPARYPACLLSSALGGGAPPPTPGKAVACWSSLDKEKNWRIKTPNVCPDRWRSPEAGAPAGARFDALNFRLIFWALEGVNRVAAFQAVAFPAWPGCLQKAFLGCAIRAGVSDSHLPSSPGVGGSDRAVGEVASPFATGEYEKGNCTNHSVQGFKWLNQLHGRAFR